MEWLDNAVRGAAVRKKKREHRRKHSRWMAFFVVVAFKIGRLSVIVEHADAFSSD